MHAYDICEELHLANLEFYPINEIINKINKSPKLFYKSCGGNGLLESSIR